MHSTVRATREKWAARLARHLALLLVFAPSALGLGCASYTSKKLQKMSQIRGMEPGSRIETYVVRDKQRIRGAYWLSWTERSIRRPGNHRINLDQEIWRDYEAGSSIRITYVPGDSKPYHREGIFASDENFRVDRLLLKIELAFSAASLLAALAFLWIRQQWKASGRQREPPDSLGLETRTADEEPASSSGVKGDEAGLDEPSAPQVSTSAGTVPLGMLVSSRFRLGHAQRPVDLTVLTSSVCTYFDAFLIAGGSIPLWLGWSFLGDSDPTLAILLIVSGAISAMAWLAIPWRWVTGLRCVSVLLSGMYVVQVVYFLSSSDWDGPNALTWIEVIGIAVVFYGLPVAYPALLIWRLADRYEHAAAFLSEVERPLPKRRWFFGASSIVAVSTSPLALIVFLGAGFATLALMQAMSENGAHGKAQVMAGVLLTGVWHLSKRLSAIGNLRRFLPRRRFSLYLRPFGDDGARIAGGEDTRQFYSWLLFLPTFEEALVSAMSSYGRVFAVARAGKPPIGAVPTRIDPSKEWQQHVMEWVEDAAAIVLVLGSSEGVAWEVEHVLRTKARQKTVFVLPPKLGQRFQATGAQTLDRLQSFAEAYRKGTGEEAELPRFDLDSILGCHWTEDGLRWYEAETGPISGYGLGISYMLERLPAMDPAVRDMLDDDSR